MLMSTKPSRSVLHRERFDPHLLTAVVIPTLLRQENETIALDHRAQDPRALGACGRDLPATLRIRHRAAWEFHQAGFFVDDLAQPSAKAGRRPILPPHELPESRPDDFEKHHH